MASSDSRIDKPQRGRPKRAELPDVIINTGAQSIKRASLRKYLKVTRAGNKLPKIGCQIDFRDTFANHDKKIMGL